MQIVQAATNAEIYIFSAQMPEEQGREKAKKALLETCSAWTVTRWSLRDGHVSLAGFWHGASLNLEAKFRSNKKQIRTY